MKFILTTKSGVVLDTTYDIDVVAMWQKGCKKSGYKIIVIAR